jgi:hypothetical protein
MNTMPWTWKLSNKLYRQRVKRFKKMVKQDIQYKARIEKQ